MTKSSIQILTAPYQVEPYVSQVIELADTNKKALGFLQKGVFREQANRGRLWIAVSEHLDECLGYLLFGGRNPTLRVFQLYVKRTQQKLGIGRKLVTSLVEWGERFNYLTIAARVAADLPANSFWEKAGFVLVRQESGGKSRGRIINIRVRELNTPSLLDMMSCRAVEPKTRLQQIQLTQRPIVGLQTYVIDLNIFFDIVKKRINRTDATRFISAGLSQEARVMVTPEFVKELERNSPQDKPDPILEFARALPVLPLIPNLEIGNLLHELEPIIFPGSVTFTRKKVQSISDLTHLAYCIHHRATGFITREKAILAASEKLQEMYMLETLSPADLTQPVNPHSCISRTLRANLGREDVAIMAAEEADRGEVERFLIARGVIERNLSTIWHPGATSYPRRRVTARVGSNLLAVASWDRSSSVSQSTVLHLYVDETSLWAETVIDHVLEVVLRDTQSPMVRMVVLDTSIEQTKTKNTAVKRGFLKTFWGDRRLPAGQLSKLAANGLISTDNWDSFRTGVERSAGLRLPMRMPSNEEFNNTGIVIKNQSEGEIYRLSLFDFETLVSPGVVLCPGRSAVIVPIQLRFAKDLFAYVQPQVELFPSPEALLHVEKAYFRANRKTSHFNRGTLVLFYLSGAGGGTKEIIGCARVTYSEVLSVDEIELKLERQGVLSRSVLENIANHDRKVHAFTFDNFCPFLRKIPFNFLKERSIVSGANLITVEEVLPRHCVQICEYGYDFRSSADA